MLVKINQTEIFNTATVQNYKLDDNGLLEIYDNYRSVAYSHNFEEAMQIWRQLLEQIVVQHHQYLAVLNDPETSRKLAQDYNKQTFDDFIQLEQNFRRNQGEKEREYQERTRQELFDEGITIENLKF